MKYFPHQSNPIQSECCISLDVGRRPEIGMRCPGLEMLCSRRFVVGRWDHNGSVYRKYALYRYPENDQNISFGAPRRHVGLLNQPGTNLPFIHPHVLS